MLNYEGDPVILKPYLPPGTASDPIFEADIVKLYGKEFEPYLSVQPYSAFFADGSQLVVRAVGRIRHEQAL
jgi:hypothetical protein